MDASTTSTSRPANPLGARAPPGGATVCASISRTPSRRKRRSPTANGVRVLRQHRSGRRAGPEWQDRLDEGARFVRTSNGTGSARPPRPSSTRIVCTSSTTTAPQSFIAAFDAKTGDEIWRTNREEAENWSTPFVWENELRTEIVDGGSGKVRSYDLDGKLLWELKGTPLTSPTPFAKHGLLFMNAGYPGNVPRPVYAIRPGAIGRHLAQSRTQQATSTSRGTSRCSAPTTPRRWSTATTTTPCSIAASFSATTREPARRYTAASGSRPRRAGFTASPWAYNGKIFLLSEDGDTFVVQAGPEFKLLGKNSLNEMSMATPAVVRGSVILGRNRSSIGSRGG